MDKALLRTDRLFHYVLNPEIGIAPEIIRDGLRPLSDFPESERWQAVNRAMPGFFEDLYREWAEPVLGRPYPGRSGGFLTPIDFRLLPASPLADRTRIVVPLGRIDPSWSCLKYAGDLPRTSLRLNSETLTTAAHQWPAEAVLKWFGLDRTKMFLHVPQVVTYQPGGVGVAAADIEGADS